MVPELRNTTLDTNHERALMLSIISFYTYVVNEFRYLYENDLTFSLYFTQRCIDALRDICLCLHKINDDVPAPIE